MIRQILTNIEYHKKNQINLLRNQYSKICEDKAIISCAFYIVPNYIRNHDTEFETEINISKIVMLKMGILTFW